MSNRRKTRTIEHVGPKIDFDQAEEVMTTDHWLFRLRSTEPYLIEDHEVILGLRPMLERGRTLMERTSFMTNGPNREVLFDMARWTPGKGWVSQKQGTYTMKKGDRPR